MKRIQRHEFYLLICLIILFPGFAFSDERKDDSKSTLSDKALQKAVPGKIYMTLKSPTQKKYSLNIIRPNPDIDPEIVKNSFDPNIEYKLKNINPFSKKIKNGYKALLLGSLIQKFQQKVKNNKTPGTSPDKDKK